MSVVPTSLKNLSAFLQNHQVSFTNGLLILFTIGGEQIFRFNAFKCPCTQPEAYRYTIIFMLLPALILGIIGVAVSNLTWRILHGSRQRSKEAANGFWKTSGYLFIAIARAAIVPCAWLFIALLDGNYYACMMAKEPCEKGPNGKDDTEEVAHLKALSQCIAWISLGTLILLSFIVICIVRCCDSMTYVQYKYLTSYREAEQEKMEEAIKTFAKEKAKKNVETFIGNEKNIVKNDWDNISKVPDHITPKKESKDQGDNVNVSQDFLTPLDEWASLHTLPENDNNQQKEQMPPSSGSTSIEMDTKAIGGKE